MFNKIMKRGGRKVPKSDENDPAVFSSPYHSGPGGSVVSTSNVTVNHASRAATGVSSGGGILPQAQIGTAAADSCSSSPQIENLPLFRDVPVPERQLLFFRKLQLCSFVFDFSDTLKFAREKETKRQTLIELVDFIQSGTGRLSELVQEELIRMIGTNIFRCLPPASHENTGSENADPEEEDPYLDPTWPHLQIVYELLLRYIISSDTDTKIAKRYIDHSFVLRLLDLFDSEDPRERDYLKSVLHRIYGKFMVHRPFVRKAINNIFYRFIFETERHCGIGELLEILGSIINGFALPMKEEHKLFLVRALIPLHKPKSVSVYHQQLSYCVTQFVEKDYKLAEIVIRGLQKYWPVTNCQKEVLFLGELEEVLEVTQASEFQRCMVPLFKQIARCLNSPHFQVAERALFLWNNDHIVSLIAQNRGTIFPIMYYALEKNMRGHWNQAVHGLTSNVRKLLLDMDSELFEECDRMHVEKEARAKYLEEQRQVAWTRLEAAVAAITPADDMVLVN